MTTAEEKVLDKAKKVERLYNNKDFQDVILEDYINTQVLALGLNFDATESDLDSLKAITHLSRYLETIKSDGKIVIQTNNKG